MKKIIRTSWTDQLLDDNKLCRALLQYCNTPSQKNVISSAQNLHGHPVQNTFPVNGHSFSAEWQHKMADIKQQVAKTLENSTAYYNTHAHSLLEIHVGSSVDIQKYCTETGHIAATIQTHSGSGHVLVHNRCFLHHCVPSSIITRSSTTQLVIPPRRSNSP